MKTYTEDELKAEVAQAVTAAIVELRTELDELKSQATAGATEIKVAAAKAEAEGRLAEVQQELDKMVLEAQSEREKREALEASIATATAAAERDAEMASRRDDRLAKVREVASFPDEYVTANAERWVAMDDDSFVAYLEDIRAVASKTAGDQIPRGTALTAARVDGPTNKVGAAFAALRELRGAVDPRTL